MPKIIATATKGLVQSSGAGFKQLDFIMGYEGNLTGTANAISIADGQGGEIGTPTAAQIAAATLTANALNTSDITGATGTTTLYLPAATAGVHTAIKFGTTSAGGNACKILASHTTYNSAGEAERIAAGGTAAVFGAVRIGGVGSSINEFNHDVSSGSEKILTIAWNGTHDVFDANGTLHFYCIEDGVWLVRLFGTLKGTAASATALAIS